MVLRLLVIKLYHADLVKILSVFAIHFNYLKTSDSLCNDRCTTTIPAFCGYDLFTFGEIAPPPHPCPLNGRRGGKRPFRNLRKRNNLLLLSAFEI
jgi:hypothetical protein